MVERGLRLLVQSGGQARLRRLRGNVTWRGDLDESRRARNVLNRWSRLGGVRIDPSTPNWRWDEARQDVTMAWVARRFRCLESALAQPRATFGGTDLHPTAVQEAAALGFSLTLNHPFVDGNKRVAHAAMEVFLLLNGLELQGTVDEQERLMLDLAAGRLTREERASWIAQHAKPVGRSAV